MQEIHNAVVAGDLEAVRKIVLEDKISVDTPTNCEEKWTPLNLASRDGYINIVQFLLENGAQAQPKEEAKHYPLRAATLGGYLDICKLLVEHGADLNQPSFGNRTPLQGAVYKNHPQVVEWLVMSGAKDEIVNSFGERARDIAKAKGHTECLKALDPLCEC
mmetsp:Transcript_8864/g.11162  ORF Transcript_8864/g.11162 Transcript_8864/m.11162 type:complete len:161 (+) Transcript_8864:163-645(+)